MSAERRSQRETNDIWKQVSIDLPAQAKLESGGGIWEDIRLKPGGVWKESRNETISLVEAREHKRDLWNEANDETIILPRASRFNVFDKLKDQLVNVEPVVQGPEGGLWENLEQETVILPRAQRSLPRIRIVSRMKPVRISGWALKELKTTQGEAYWVLKLTDGDQYLRLNEQQVFLWNQMDGMHSLQDLAVSMFVNYKNLAIGSLMDFVNQLEQKGFLLDEGGVDVYQSAGVQIERRSLYYPIKRLGRALLRSEFSFRNVDRFFSVLYRFVGSVVFSRLFLGGLVLIMVLGVPAYVALAMRGELSLLGNPGSAWLGLATLWLAQLVAFFLHESAHALTTKHYGRTVRRGGIGMYLGMPAFFVDTTDIWMEARSPRILVTWAGPMAGFVLGGLVSLVLLFSPPTTWAGIGYQFATFCMLGSLVNLNPLVKYDGYFILMDWLEIPLLREKSFRFVRQDLFKRLQDRVRLSREEKIYTIYGAGAAIFTAFSIVLVVVLYGKTLIRLFTWVASLVL